MNDKTKTKAYFETAREVKKTGRLNVDDLRRAAKRLGYTIKKNPHKD